MNYEPLPIVQAARLEQQQAEQHWLIEGLWARSAIGLIGGAPKCCKTWLGLDMAVSVATGTKALGHFETKAPGKALVFLAEDALPQVRARLEALCRQRHQDLARLELYVITAPVLRLDLAADQERLAQAIDQLRPRLLLLDPLVRLHRLDENSAAEISGLLGYIRDLQRRFEVAIVLVHHASKKQRSQPGQALRGSSDLHAIGDCNAYLARDGERIVLTLEHRAAKSPPPMVLELVAGPGDQPTHLRVRAGGQPSEADSVEELPHKVIAVLAGTTAPQSRAALRERLRVNNQRLGDALQTLLDAGRATRSELGWSLA